MIPGPHGGLHGSLPGREVLTHIGVAETDLDRPVARGEPFGRDVSEVASLIHILQMGIGRLLQTLAVDQRGQPVLRAVIIQVIESSLVGRRCRLTELYAVFLRAGV